jgi:hypothetical protein
MLAGSIQDDLAGRIRAFYKHDKDLRSYTPIDLLTESAALAKGLGSAPKGEPPVPNSKRLSGGLRASELLTIWFVARGRVE